MGRVYRVNPFCPYCHEEHMYWNIRLTDKEQAILDEHTAQHKGETALDSLLADPGIVVFRQFKCDCCKKNFNAKIGIWREDEIGWKHPDFLL